MELTVTEREVAEHAIPRPPPLQEIEPALIAAALSLSLSQGQALCVLMGNSLTPLRVIEERTGFSPEGRRALIFRLRERLAKHRVRIISHPAAGYSIPQEDRQRIHAIVNSFRSI
jgi:hypothetical protein